MGMRGKVGLIEPDDTLRPQVLSSLAGAGLQAEPFESVREFLSFGGDDGYAVLVADERLDALSVRDRLCSDGKWRHGAARSQLGQGRSEYATARRRAAEARTRLRALSPREGEVLEHMAAGRSNKTIGMDLGISPRTVEIHRANMLSKLGAGSSTEALRMYFEDTLLNDSTVDPD